MCGAVFFICVLWLIGFSPSRYGAETQRASAFCEFNSQKHYIECAGAFVAINCVQIWSKQVPR